MPSPRDRAPRPRKRRARAGAERAAAGGGPAPHVIVVAGPNGAGESTTAPRLLRDTLAVTEFVNADTIAGGLSAFRPDSVALAAGRIMLELAAARTSFAFETALASRSFAPWLAALRRDGYRIELVFLWLESADLAVSRVAARVRLGGRDVPEPIARRRYDAGLRNLFRLYIPLAHSWQIFDNSQTTGPRPVALGQDGKAPLVQDGVVWRRLKQDWHD